MLKRIRDCSRKYPAMSYEKYRHLLKKIQDARNIVHRTIMPQSISKQAPWDLTQFQHLFHCSKYSAKSLDGITISCPIVFSWISSMVWNLLTCKVILVWGKARSHRAPNLGCKGAESPGWFDVSPKLYTRCDAWVGALLWWSCQSPGAHSCSHFHHIASLKWWRTLR